MRTHMREGVSVRLNLFKRCLQRKLLSLILIGLIAEGFIGFIDITRVFGQPSITLKWRKNASIGSTWMGPLAADLNNDGLMEIVITTRNGTNRGAVAVLDPLSGNVIWSLPYGGDHVPCEIIDLNKDGIPEILMGPQYINGSSGGVLALHGNNGSVYWYNRQAACKGTYIAVADINADGYPEIFSATPGKVTALTHDGHIFASTYTYYTCWGGMTIGDTDFDGVFEVYLGERSDSYPSYPSGGRGLRAFWADNLTEIWAYPDILCSSQAPVLDDVDKDGDLEIIILDQSPAGIAVINTDGSVNTYRGIYRKQSISGLRTHSNPPVADLDGDGNLELIACGTSQPAFTPPKIWDLVDWKLDATLPFECNQPPGVADVDGDEKLEIIAPNQQNVTIFKYNPATQNYDIIYTIPLAMAHPFSIAQDIDNDGKLELVFNQHNSWVSVYDVEVPAPTPKPRSGLYFYSQYRTRVPIYVPPPEQPPKIAEISPSDGAKNVSVSLSQLSFKLTDYQSDPMNYTVTTNPDIGSDSGINVPNGEVTIPVSGLANSTAYTWTVTATDGTHTTTRTLTFYTPWIIDSDPPTHDAPLLVSSHGTNITDEELICYNQTTTDPEGDEVTNIYHWIRDGNSITNLLMSFDTNSSTTAPWMMQACMDNSGYGNDGTVFGATWTSDGVVGGAYEFDGDDYIVIPDDPSLGGTGTWTEITVEFWVKAAAPLHGTRLVDNTLGGTGNYMVGFQTSTGDPANTLFWGITVVGGGFEEVIYYGEPLAVDTWYHVVCTYESGPGLTLYLDGAERINRPLTGNIDYDVDQQLFLGYDGAGGANRYLDGTLDEVRIYPFALTPAQIFQRFIETKDGFSSSSTIVPQETSAGEVWTCEVIPNDSWQDGTAKTSNPLTVLAVSGNNRPRIDLYTPTETTPKVYEVTNLNFTHISSDPDGDTLFYSWLLDSVEQADTENWNYSPGYGDAGTHNVTLIVSDGALSDSQQWNVTVIRQYELVISVVGNGTTTPTPGTHIFAADTEVNLTAVADPDWAFLEWSGNLTGSENPTTIIMDGNKTVTATFIQEEYTLTINVFGNGSVTPNASAPYYYGDIVELTAVPDFGWKFFEWSVDLAGSTNPDVITMDSDKTVNATFTLNGPPTIDSYYPPSNPNISEGESQLFNITCSDPDGDSLTVQWYLNGTPASTLDNYTFTSDYDSAGTYNVTVVVSDGLAETSHEWTLTVTNVNWGPTIDSYSPVDLEPEVDEVDSLNFTHISSDPDGDLLTYSWLLDSIEQATTQNWTYTPDYAAAGTHNVTLIVSDGNLFDSQQWNVTVLDVNRPPVIDDYYPLADPTISEGESQLFNVTYHDPDGNPVSVQWLLNSSLVGSDDNYTFTADYEDAGVYNVTVVISDTLNQTSHEWILTVSNVNRPPTIDSFYPPSDPTISEGESQEFNVTYSDPDGDSLTVQWLLNGSQIGSNDNYTFVADYDSAGVYNVTVVVSDLGGLFHSQQWNLTVLDVNRSPVIDSYYPDSNPTISEDESQVFNVTYSDPDGDLVMVQWYLNGSLVGSTDNYTFNADYDSAGTYNVTVIISDGLVETSHEWTLTVLNVNRPPTIDDYYPLADPTISEGESQGFNVTYSDLDGDILTVEWYLNGSFVESADNYTFVSDYDSAGVYNVTVIVSDGLAEASHEWTLTVLDVNRPPTIDSFTPADLEPTVDEGSSLNFTHTSSDPDGDPLTYSWLLDDIEQATTQNWIYTPGYEDSGFHNVTLVVSDGDLTDSQQWNVTVNNINRPPSINSFYPPADPTILENESQLFNVTYSDPDGDTLTVQWYLNGTPVGSDDNYTFTSDYDSAGVYNVTVVVSDGLAEVSHEWTLTVLDVNRTPTIDDYTPVDLEPPVDEGTSLTFTHISSDPDNDTLTYSWLLDSVEQANTQNWTYTPGYEDAGTHNVTLVISDGELTDSQQWNVTVLDVNRSPTIDDYYPATDPTISESESQVFNVTYSDPDGDPVTVQWLLNGSLVGSTDNYTFNADYDSAGTYNVTVVVSDGLADMSHEWNLTVLNVNRVPVIDSFYPLTDPAISEEEMQEFNITYSDPDDDPLTVEWYLNGSLVGSTDNYTFTADYTSAGTYNVTVVISDGLAETSHEWTLTVLDVNRSPTIDSYYPLIDPTVSEDESQEFNVTYSDLDGDILTVQWYLNGTPTVTNDNYTFTAGYDDAGVYNVTVVVSDGLAEASHEWTLTVLDVNRAPTIDSYTPLEPEPQVDEGDNLNFTHTSSDPDEDPLSYSWLLDNLEQATNQNWTYTPSYEEAGTHNVTLVVSDSGGLFDSQQWNVTVNNINRPPIINSFYPPADPIILEGESQKFNITKSDLDGDSLTVTWWLNQSDTGETSDSYTYTANYESAGTYNVTVVVSDDLSQTSYQWTLTVTNVERDIAITNLTLSKNVVGEGYALSINVTITNQGELIETFNVTVYANTTIIDTLTNITLTSANSTTVTFTWNTTGFAYGNYIVSAVADAAPGEADTTDNTYINGVVLVTIAGDLDGDGDCDMFDFNAFAQAYATSIGDPRYDVKCDFDDDGDVDMYDFEVFVANYGKTV